MKISKTSIAFLFLSLAAILAACGKGGTETGTTIPTDMITYATKIESAVNVLLPEMQTNGASAQIAGKSIDYMTSSEWDLYLLPTNVTYLTDIFGPAGGHPAPETRIRVLMSRFKTTLESLFTTDPYIECAGGDVLNEPDTIEIAFFGGVSNGTANNRYYRCVTHLGSDIYPSTILYGRDASQVLRVVQMEESDTWNDLHGYNAWNRSVTYVTYGEVAGNSMSHGYIDLQYAQAIIYNGSDAERYTDDDLIYKNRSRIAGRVELDSAGESGLGTGDFTIIKYDVGTNNDGGGMITTTNQGTGRGSYADGNYSLFNISINNSALQGAAGIYCIQNTTTGLPVYADPTNCQEFEENITWEDGAIPFQITPTIESDFASKRFYQANDTDLIDNSGSNFTIPTYVTE